MAAACGDVGSQEFWEEFMRRPEVKKAHQQDLELQFRKVAWLEQRRYIEEQGEKRRRVGELLLEAPADLKKLIAPMFHIRVVETYLFMLLDECKRTGIPFLLRLQNEEPRSRLLSLRQAFHQGGEESMRQIEGQYKSICFGILQEQAEAEARPMVADMYTLKQLLEFGQECRREGNLRFADGRLNDAYSVYTQGVEMMSKYVVGDNTPKEKQWFQQYLLACLKNQALAALKLELYNAALRACSAALLIAPYDPKAWLRKALAEKSLGRLDEALESLTRLEDAAESAQDRRSILLICLAERQKLEIAIENHKRDTHNMFNKAFEAGVFSSDRDKRIDDVKQNSAAAGIAEEVKPQFASSRPLKKYVTLTSGPAGELLDELAAAYATASFQARVRKCALDSRFRSVLFLQRLRDIALEVQQPILEKWGFEGNLHGVREMSAAVRDASKRSPERLQPKTDRCLELLYGGREFGMADALMPPRGKC